MSRDPWRNFRYRLDSFESSLKALSYSGAFEPPQADFHNSWNFRDLSPKEALHQSRSRPYFLKKQSVNPMGYSF
jgi:hypothetical protein